MSDKTLSSGDTHGTGAAHRGPDPLVTGKRVLLALGLWLLAAGVIGTATAFAARSIGAAAVTAIVVGEVYTLLIVALAIVFRPGTAEALGLVGCRNADVGFAFAACGGAYLIAAIDDAVMDDWPSPVLLQRISSGATRVQVARNAPSTQALRMLSLR